MITLRGEPGSAPRASETSAALGPGRTVEISLWVALLGGGLEALVLLLRQRLLGHYVWAGPDVLWMAPLAWAALTVPIGLAGWAGAAVARRQLGASTLVGLLGFSVGSILLLNVRALHPAATLLLAAGASVQLSRSVRAREVAFVRLSRRSAPLLMLGLLVAFFDVSASRLLREGKTIRELPKGAGPNLLLIVLDAVRAGNLGLSGYERPTSPVLDSLGRAGIVFDRAYATASWTLPSHGSMFTGRLARSLSADWLEPLDTGSSTVAERLRDAGYVTAAFSANFYYVTRESGLDRGFLHFDDYRLSWKQILLSSTAGQILFENSDRVARQLRRGRIDRALLELPPPPERVADRKHASRLNADFLAWLDKTEKRPFFAFLNYFDAHRPYYAPDSILARFRTGDERRSIDDYDAAIAYMDRSIGELLDSLDARRLLDNTVVVVTSDHGELFGEHDLTGHGNSLYLDLLHVPLIIRAPGVTDGTRIETAVSLVDLYPTLLELAGLEIPESNSARTLASAWTDTVGDRRLDPRPLFAAVREGINTPPDQPVSHGDMLSIIWGGFHYIRRSDGAEELYDIESDPLEEHQLVGESGWEDELEELRLRLNLADGMEGGFRQVVSGAPPVFGGANADVGARRSQ